MFKSDGKSASLIRFLVLAGLVGAVWIRFEKRNEELEARVNALEADAKTLAPLSDALRGFRPGVPLPNAYAAMQATGAPNVPEAGDNGLAWCPASEDAATEWLEVKFDPPVEAGEIRIHASFNPGAVSRVTGTTAAGETREIWTGTSPREPRQSIPVSPVVTIASLRIEVETARVPGWNEIDAVGLVDTAGIERWATSAASSSVWKE